MEERKIKDLVSKELKVFWGDAPANGISGDKLTSVIKTNNLSYEGKITYSSIALRNIDQSKIGDNYLNQGDLLIEKSGGTKTHSVGYVNYFEGENQKYVANNFILAIRPNPQLVLPKYLFYGIRHSYENGVYADCFNKTTGIQNLKKDAYLSKNISFRDTEEQKVIVSELDSIDFLITLKRKALENMNELVKSRFIEMFGHYFEDVRYFVKVGDIATATIGLTYKPDNVTDEGIIVLRSGNIQNAELCLSDDIVRVSNIRIKEDKFVRENDILMCSRNGSARLVGKCCLIPKLNEQMSYGAFMTVIRSKYPYFLNGFFNSTYFLQQLTGTQTASVNQITTGMLNSYTVIKPSDTEENEFAEFVKLIDKSKFVVQQQIKDLQELLDKKMDEYFSE